ncbi:serpin family protein [Rufibacter aurantiacus]|uniref:serpin family protein n=1 Tax=Rufibacter aurantiacus TaxID=2817374 RepID=UPI001B304DB1|nr:serpin family protein [Rufibacter aurantiacus]
MNKTLLKTSFLAIAGSLLMLTNACEGQDPSPEDNTPKTRPLTVQESKTVAGSNEFAFKSFAQISQLEEGKNVFISPLSLSMALNMTYNGAANGTKEAMKQTLGLGDASDEEINASFKSLAELLVGMDKKVEFTSANSIWLNDHFELLAPFVSTNQNYFQATVKPLDFSSPTAKDEINNWVNDKTKGKIKTIVEQMTQDHVLFLINAIYFKGAWTYQFDKQLTAPRLFKLENGATVSHPFMTLRKGKYLMYRDATKQVIDLPYGNGQYSMTMIVPSGQRTVQDLLPELSHANVTQWLAEADTSSLELKMPKFKLELKYSENLEQALKNLGMAVAFSDQADFSRINATGNLSISEVNHKTFVEVNEEGTEAAAATSVGIMVTSVPLSVMIDKPFVFLIREKSTNAILFIGRLMQPQ